MVSVFYSVHCEHSPFLSGPKGHCDHAAIRGATNGDRTVNNPITPAQCRAARGLIELTQTELAQAAGVSLETLRDFEAGRGQPTRSQVEAIRAAIKSAGIEFTGEGVRWALPPLESSYYLEPPRLVGGSVDNSERAAANRARVDGRNTPSPTPYRRTSSAQPAVGNSRAGRATREVRECDPMEITGALQRNDLDKWEIVDDGGPRARALQRLRLRRPDRRSLDRHAH